jgi:CRP-like cAMP-binding protein
MDESELKEVPLFATLKAPDRRAVAMHADCVDVAEGRVLAKEGQLAFEFFVIREGTAEVSREGARVCELGPGDFFGEIGVLEHVPRTASVVATSPMDLIVITDMAFKRIASELPSVAEQIGAAIAERLAPASG